MLCSHQNADMIKSHLNEQLYELNMFTVNQLALKRSTIEVCNDDVVLFYQLARNSSYDRALVERVSNVIEEFFKPFQLLMDENYSRIS